MEQNLYFDGAKSIRLTQLGTISSGQDGAIYNGYIFRFNQAGLCRVFCLSTLEKIAEFTLEKADLLVPHSNSVCFGPNRWEEDDEFPIIYTNIYNNYSSCENRLEGVCCAYRIVRDGTQFTSQLLQVIQVIDDTLQIAAEEIVVQRFAAPWFDLFRIVGRIAIGESLRKDLIEYGILNPCRGFQYIDRIKKREFKPAMCRLRRGRVETMLV